MTNTKFRKRILLSSVAMLLVALVALGSATFAWFSVRNDATATGLNGKTVKSSTLQISETAAAGTWSNDIVFAANTSTSTDAMQPVTFDGSRWAYATSKGFNTGYATDSAGLTNCSMNDRSHWSTIYVRYGDTVPTSPATKSITVKVVPKAKASGETTDEYNAKLSYARVALIPAPAVEGVNSAWASGTTAKIFGQAADDHNSTGIWEESTATGASLTNVWGDEQTALTFGSVSEGSVYKMFACVYFEGTDDDCVDSAAGVTVNDFAIKLEATT